MYNSREGHKRSFLVSGEEWRFRWFHFRLCYPDISQSLSLDLTAWLWVGPVWTQPEWPRYLVEADGRHKHCCTLGVECICVTSCLLPTFSSWLSSSLVPSLKPHFQIYGLLVERLACPPLCGYWNSHQLYCIFPAMCINILQQRRNMWHVCALDDNATQRTFSPSINLRMADSPLPLSQRSSLCAVCLGK